MHICIESINPSDVYIAATNAKSKYKNYIMYLGKASMPAPTVVPQTKAMLDRIFPGILLLLVGDDVDNFGIGSLLLLKPPRWDKI